MSYLNDLELVWICLFHFDVHNRWPTGGHMDDFHVVIVFDGRMVVPMIVIIVSAVDDDVLLLVLVVLMLVIVMVIVVD